MTRTQIIARYIQETYRNDQNAGIVKMAQLAAMTKDERIGTLSAWIDGYVRFLDEQIAAVDQQLTALKTEQADATANWKVLL